MTFRLSICNWVVVHLPRTDGSAGCFQIGMLHLGNITSGSRQGSLWILRKRLHKACTLGRSRGSRQRNIHVLIPSSSIVDANVWCGAGRSGSGVLGERAEWSDESFLLSQVSSSKSWLRAQVAVCPHSQDESDLRRACSVLLRCFHLQK